jgi:plastocyanin
MATPRRLILVLASGLLLALPAAAQAADTTVTIASGAFGPTEVTVTQGGTVRRLNNDVAIHDAVGVDGSWKTPLLGINDEATVTFDTAGYYEYVCSLHRRMSGSVRALAAPPDTATMPLSNQDGPNGLILLVAGVIGVLAAMRRFSSAFPR